MWMSPYKVNNKQLRGGSVYIGEVGPFLTGGDTSRAALGLTNQLPIGGLIRNATKTFAFARTFQAT